MLPEHVVALARRAGSTPDDSLALGARRGPDARRTRSVAANPIVRYVADALRFYMEFHARYDGFYGAFIHDPLAVAAALDPHARRDRGAVTSTSRPAASSRPARRSRTGGGLRGGRRTSTSPSRRTSPRVPRPAHRTRRGAGGGPVGRGTLDAEGRAGLAASMGGSRRTDELRLVAGLRRRPDRRAASRRSSSPISSRSSSGPSCSPSSRDGRATSRRRPRR